MGKISHKTKIWLFPNPTGGLLSAKNWQCKSGLPASAMYKLLGTPVVSLYKHQYNTWLQYIKELNKLMWNSSYYCIKRNLSFFYCLYVIARAYVQPQQCLDMIVIYLTCYLFKKLSCFFTLVVKPFRLIFLLISISILFLFGHLVQAK